MRQRVIPLLAAVTKHRPVAGGYDETTARGLAVLNSPQLNKGTAFTSEERKALCLTGLLPPEITTLAQQVKAAYIQYERLPDALSRNIYLTALHDRNEVLFYRLFTEHLREMIPIVNELTVGAAIEQYRHECRRPRGVYLSIDHPDEIEEAFANFGAGAGDIDLILATDAEQVPGVGDCGVGGIEVSIGKLAIYTAAGGIDPARAIPVMLDVGTDREDIMSDPMYIGNRHPRVRGKKYDAFIDAYIGAATRLFPHALMQFEDFAPDNGRRIVETYRERMCIFNGDMQGMGAIALAAAISAVRICGTPLRNQRIVIFGAGSAGIGVADQICDAIVREGVSRDNAERRFWCVDQQGLLTSDMNEEMRRYQRNYARPVAERMDWHDDNVAIGLAEVVRRVKPTMLIGTSTAGAAFTEAIVKEMAAHTERPIIFSLGITPAQAAAKPADLLAWTGGRALIVTGGAFSPVTYKGVTYVIAQANSAMLYPGLALGTVVARADRISGRMFMAAASAVSGMVTVRQQGASLLPHVDDLREVSAMVAVAVAEAATEEGIAGVSLNDIVQQVQDAMWQPEYRRLTAI
jgi:malate dehydrogenase (oxaloacetate-decarboxylating)